MTDQTQTIAAQNDRFRRDGAASGLPGAVIATAGVAALPSPLPIILLAKVRAFNDFNKDNDPYGEHDFGSVELLGAGKVFWKIDYYADEAMEYGSDDPTDPAKTYRVLTLMLADEY